MVELAIMQTSQYLYSGTAFLGFCSLAVILERLLYFVVIFIYCFKIAVVCARIMLRLKIGHWTKNGINADAPVFYWLLLLIYVYMFVWKIARRTVWCAACRAAELGVILMDAISLTHTKALTALVLVSLSFLVSLTYYVYHSSNVHKFCLGKFTYFIRQ